jgi:glutathionyl-hydroquinone reductase
MLKHNIISETVNMLIIKTYFYSKHKTINKHKISPAYWGRRDTKTCGMPFNNLITTVLY